MADYSFTAADRPNGVHKALANTTEDTVTINSADRPCYAQVINASLGDIFIDLNGTVLTAPGQNGSLRIQAGKAYNWYIGANAAVLVRLIGPSAGSWDYSVQASPLSAV